MNCRRARGLFSEYHDGVLKTDLEQEVGGHLSACPACRGEFRSFETGIRILKKLKPAGPEAATIPGRPDTKTETFRGPSSSNG